MNDACSCSVPVPDSKVPDGPALLFGAVARAPFVDGLKWTSQ
ncbi:DUF397 domain-containing protein [Streptomyces sp. NPDC088553]